MDELDPKDDCPKSDAVATAMEAALVAAIATVESISSAARTAGHNRKTVYQRLRDPAFQMNAVMNDSVGS
jgi:molybdenum-dependent DNA-binding transcriptional regulator ModE